MANEEKDVIEEVFEELKHKITKEAKEAYDENKDFLKQIGTDATLELFRNIIPGNEKRLETLAYYKYLQTLSDEELLEIKRKSVKEAAQWAYIETKKKKIAKDLMKKIGRITANVIIKAVKLKIDSIR